ncbi:MAG: VanZ family protein [Bacteroidota bacterium]
MKYFIPAIIWGTLILYLSAGPSVQMPPSWWDFIAIDKVGHLVFYGIFTCLLVFGFHKKNQGIQKNTLLKSLIISSFYGIGMEIMQYSLFPNRYFEVLDIIANISGSLLGLLFFRYMLKK